MFAYTNKDVAALNAHARALHEARGDLAEDQTLKTAYGKAIFAAGDRIQFSGNGRTQAERNAGLTNGRVGTIAALEIGKGGKARVTVDLDTAKGAKPQQVSFVVGETPRRASSTSSSTATRGRSTGARAGRWTRFMSAIRRTGAAAPPMWR